MSLNRKRLDPFSSIYLSEVTEARQRFFRAITHSIYSDDRLQECDFLSWLHYIEDGLTTDSRPLITSWINHLRVGRPPLAAQWFELLTVIITCIRNFSKDSPVTVDGLAEATAQAARRPWTAEISFAGRRATYVALGCLTMLFEPAAIKETGPDCVRISSPGAKAKPMSNASELSVGKLLSSWKVLPRAENQDDLLFGSFLNYFTLARVAKIKIKFVNLATSHLRFDNTSKRLFVFAHPGFCAICLDPGFNFDFQERLIYDKTLNFDCDNLRRFYQDIMLSYRFLFAYDAKSQRQFLTILRGTSFYKSPFWRKLLYRPTIWQTLTLQFAESGASSSSSSSSSLINTTPQYWSEAVKDPEERLSEQDNYDASVDFPFLSSRLLHLQKYCARQNPTRWTEIFWDQRHKQQWLTLWAAIIIGSLSVLLSLLQVVLTGISIRYN